MSHYFTLYARWMNNFQMGLLAASERGREGRDKDREIEIERQREV